LHDAIHENHGADDYLPLGQSPCHMNLGRTIRFRFDMFLH